MTWDRVAQRVVPGLLGTANTCTNLCQSRCVRLFPGQAPVPMVTARRLIPHFLPDRQDPSPLLRSRRLRSPVPTGGVGGTWSWAMGPQCLRSPGLPRPGRRRGCNPRAPRPAPAPDLWNPGGGPGARGGGGDRGGGRDGAEARRPGARTPAASTSSLPQASPASQAPPSPALRPPWADPLPRTTAARPRLRLTAGGPRSPAWRRCPARARARGSPQSRSARRRRRAGEGLVAGPALRPLPSAWSPPLPAHPGRASVQPARAGTSQDRRARLSRGGQTRLGRSRAEGCVGGGRGARQAPLLQSGVRAARGWEDGFGRSAGARLLSPMGGDGVVAGGAPASWERGLLGSGCGPQSRPAGHLGPASICRLKTLPPLGAEGSRVWLCRPGPTLSPSGHKKELPGGSLAANPVCSQGGPLTKPA